MTSLKELTEPGRQEVENTIERGDRVTDIPDAKMREHTYEIDGVTADLEQLRDELNDVIARYDKNDHEMDAAAAPHIRECIDISRRVAARDGLWHWLAVSEFPNFVYHRWPDADDEEKFLAGGTDIYSNAIHQLWWGAELTRDGDDYSRTEQLFEQGRLANDVLDSWCSRYQPAAKILTDTLHGEPSNTVNETSTAVRNKLSVYTLELMTESEIQTLLDRTLREHTS